MKTKVALFLIVLAIPALTSLAQPAAPAPSTTTNSPPDTNASAAPAPGPAPASAPAPVPDTNVVAAPAPAADTNAVAALASVATPAPDTNSVAASPAAPAPTTDTNTTATSTNAPGPDAVIDSLFFDDLPLPDVLRQLAAYADLNIEFDPRLLNQVTPDGRPVPPPTVKEKWKNVTAMQAMQGLLDNYGWQLVRDPNNPIARIAAKDPKALEPLVTSVIQLNYSDPVNIIEEITPTLSPRSWITNDVRTHQLILRTTEKELPDAKKLIAQLDSATRQVLIEAKIIETTKDLTSAKGVDWTGTLKSQHVSFGNGLTSGTVNTGNTTGTGTSGTTTTPGGRTLGGGSALSTVVSNSTSFVTTLAGSPGAGGGFSLNTANGISPSTAFLNADGVSAVLSFLNTDADTKSIALPRTVSLDGVSNRLSVIQNYPVFVQDQSAPLAGAAAGLQSARPVYDMRVDNNYLSQVGISLSVTPRIAGLSNVIISVKPEISKVDANTASATINGQVSIAGIYDRSTIETKASVPSGDTLVLGGLDQDVMNKTFTKVPILGDIPGAGYLFRSDSKEHSRDTILIFVTPTIIEDVDFQPSDSGFLKTKGADMSNVEKDNAWDSGVPYDWTKPRTVSPAYQP